MSEQNQWLREVLRENKKEMEAWPDWLKQSAKQPDEKEEDKESFDDYEELKQQTG